MILLGLSLLMATTLVHECQGALFYYHVERQVDATKAVILPKIHNPPKSNFYNVFYSFTGKGSNPKRIGEGSDLNESYGTAHERPEAPNWTKIPSRVVVEDSALSLILHLNKCM